MACARPVGGVDEGMVTSPWLEAVERALARQGWRAERVPGQLVLEMAFEAHHTRVPLHVQAYPEIGALQVVSYLGHDIPAARRSVVAEMLLRLNADLTLGAFELDYDRSRVLFRVTNLFPTPPTEPALLLRLIQTSVAEADRLTPLLTVLLRLSVTELASLNLKLFLQREDLLPPVPTAET
jgi:hypothetical protein